MNEDQTPMSQRTYRKSGGVRCPFCKSLHINSVEVFAPVGELHQTMYCLACEKDWYDIYELKSYKEIK